MRATWVRCVEVMYDLGMLAIGLAAMMAFALGWRTIGCWFHRRYCDTLWRHPITESAYRDWVGTGGEE